MAVVALATAAYAAGRASVRTAAATTSVAAAAAAEHVHDMGDAQAPALPAGATDAVERLAKSPRHGEWAVIRSGSDSIRAWVVYPERRDKAPVVLVVHEIFGLSNWIRAVADQAAADGFIAIAPDLLTMKNIPQTAAGEPDGQAATREIRTLTPDVVNRYLADVAAYGMKLPAALPKYGIVGFCWGGSTSFGHAVAAPGLGASVVYYGSSPATPALASIQAPVLGMYGGADARVNATIPPADSAMKSLRKTYEPHIFEGAGHGFLRQQDGNNDANLEATKQAWPLTVAWFRKYLGA
jgi:carboxymethylenebutenolidase